MEIFTNLFKFSMEIFTNVFNKSNATSWKLVDDHKYQLHVTIDSTTKLEDSTDKEVVYMSDLKKRKKVYGICKECNEPGTGEKWCRPCNSKRFKKNFENWTSGNKDIDELIQHSQINAVYSAKCLEWIPFENFECVTYVSRGGFGKIYSAKWPEGFIRYWDIKNQAWKRASNEQVALKSLDNSSSDLNTKLLDEIKSHIQIYIHDILPCYGITQDPKTKDYMMVLHYCERGDLRKYLSLPKKNIFHYYSKINHLFKISRGLLDIHNAGKVHKDFHSGNILFGSAPYIGDLGMCQNENQSEGIYGVLPYMAPEVLSGHQYTKAADIYSFGIIINEFLSEEIPYKDVPHDHILTIKICKKGLRPRISKDTPKLLADLITKCWDANAENRPTAKELVHIFKNWNNEINKKNSEIYLQMKEYNKMRKSKNNKNNSNAAIQIHSQAIYTSRLLNLKNLAETVNSSNLLSIQFNSADATQSRSVNPIVSEFLDCQLSESDINEIEDNNE
ncbi:kinase-like domain-containing protein [Glomus cerebriforme]|uniref:Kinase-like domain-containing protein n=1 Tax=Glomus cerebriforme TaxID=658196 RepID=A0A397SYB1_9GLOM|nr:kinase-like domain-containing protein [Glomus cerebriforme]